MNQLNIIGNLTRDPVSKATANGHNLCEFTVAVNDDKRNATFFKVTAWGHLGEVCQQYLKRGSKAEVTGMVSADSYIGKDGNPLTTLRVRATSVEFLDSKPDISEEAKKAMEMADIDISDIPY